MRQIQQSVHVNKKGAFNYGYPGHIKTVEEIRKKRSIIDITPEISVAYFLHSVIQCVTDKDKCTAGG